MENSESDSDSSKEWAVNNNIHVKQLDILDDLREQTDTVAFTYTMRQVPLVGTSMSIAYEAENGKDIFTVENLQRLCKMEEQWFGSENYVDYCVVQYGEVCEMKADGVVHSDCPCQAPGNSAVGLFYGTANMVGTVASDTNAEWCPLLGEDYVKATRSSLYASLGTAAGRAQYGFFIGADFDKKGYTSRTRSALLVGGPLEGYSNSLDQQPDDNEDQKALYLGFFNEVQDAWVEMLDMEGGFMRSVYRSGTSVDDKVEVVWFAGLLLEDVFTELLDGDLAMIIFSVLFVWFWMNVHIGSFMIASVGMFQIFCSLPFSRLFYSMVGGIEYFSILQSLVIFLVLGIGADDVFVLVDGWKQSEKDVEPRKPGESEDDYLQRRLMFAYSRTVQAVFNTSFTTSMAFISTSFSELMPISAFGIYATLCIVMNYFFVISLTPPAIILHHKALGGFGPKGWCWVNALIGKSNSLVNDEPPQTGVELVATKGEIGVDAGKSNAETAPPANKPSKLEVNAQTETLSRVLITLFEYEPSEGPLKGKKVYSLASTFTCLVCAIVLTAFSAQLALPTEAEQWFPDDHMLQRFIDTSSHYLSSGVGENPSLSLVWGARPNLKRTRFNQWEPDKHRGEARFDPHFDLANPEAFNSVKQTCALLRDYDCNAAWNKPLHKLVKTGSVVCAVEEFESWHVQKFLTYPTELYGDLSTGPVVFYDRLKEFRLTTAPSSDPYGSWEELIGVIDGNVKYVVVTGDMTVGYRTPNSIKKGVLEEVNAFVGGLLTPPSAHHVLQVSRVWVWYATNDALLAGMITGLAIAFPVAFCTLIFATQNVLIACYAIFTIAAIVGSVLGLAEREGWALGIAESIAAVIVVGFSVDYTIHLGHMYDHGGHEGYEHRAERARFAILKMGSTVLAGAITTAGSGVFMFACQLVFFNKMAFLIVATIAFSLVYSLFFFMPLLYVLGPSGKVGHVSTLFPCLAKGGEGSQASTPGRSV